VPDVCELSAYQLDDGTRENSVGGSAIDFLWLNHFEVVADAPTVRFVSVAWGQVPPGEPASILIYADPSDDGDPIDAVLLTEVPTLTADAGDDVFTVVPVPDTDIGVAGESFFVAVAMMITPDWFPAGIDKSSPYRFRSWILFDSPGTIDVTDLSHISLFTASFRGNFMIRADAEVPTDVPPDCVLRGDLTGDGVVDAADLLLVLGEQGACAAACPADANGDGAVDVEDVVEVIGVWTRGR
jgi:hypothetical protein